MSQSQTKQPARRPNQSKDTRWDRIRKRHVGNNTLTLKTEAVKRFIGMDFIGKQNECMLRGEKDERMQLNPALVMDMRHQMVQHLPRKLPLATVASQNANNACIAHKIAVEQRYIENELSRFRQQLAKNHKRNDKVKLKAKQMLELDNTRIMQSLEATCTHIEQFYDAPVEALAQVNEICKAAAIFEFEDETEDKENDVMVENINGEYAEPSPTIQIPNPFANLECDLFEEHEKSLQRVDYVEPELNVGEEEAPPATIEQPAKYDSLVKDYIDLILDYNILFDDCEEDILSRECPEHKLKMEVVANIARTSNGQPTNKEAENEKENDEVEKYETAIVAAPELAISSEEPIVGEHENQKQFAKSPNRLPEKIEVEDKDEVTHPINQTPAKVQNKGEVTHPNTQTKAKVHFATDVLEQQQQDHDDHDTLLIIKRLELPAPKKELLTERSVSDSEAEASIASNQEQNQIIEQLFQARTHTNIATLRKYFIMWIHYTTISKIEREHTTTKNDRIHKINVFLDNIRREKRRIRKDQQCGNGEENEQDVGKQTGGVGTVQIAKKYKNKIKIQQDIIDLQKLKLERQERVIMELKLNKFSDDAKEARLDLKNELKAVIRSGDPKAKAKAKCLQLIGNLRDAEDDDFARLQGRSLMMPKFLQEMQERALERSVKHEQARQRRLQQEAEKEAQKLAAEEAKRLEDEEAKRMRIEALREKRRLEKMSKIIKERARQRAIENNQKSQEFCRRLLLRRVGMEGFKRLLARKRENQRACEAFRRNIFKRTYFFAWLEFYTSAWEERAHRADALYFRILRRNAVKAWQQYVQDERCKLQVAVDWHELKVTEWAFGCWHNYTKRMKMIEDAKMRQASAHHEWHLKWKVLDCWQRLPQVLQLEKETEERRQRWRLKIWELLPDYTPNRDDML